MRKSQLSSPSAATRRLAFCAATALIFSSCYESPESDAPDAEAPDRVPCTLMLAGDWTGTITGGGFDDAGTRATSLAASSMTDLWLYDFDAASGDLLQTIHLTSGFDAPQLMLSRGEHQLSVIASRGTQPSATDAAITWAKPHDTFAATTAITAGSQPITRSVTLQRRVARLTLHVTDRVPSEAASLSAVMSNWGTSLTADELTADPLSAYTYEMSTTSMAGLSDFDINFYTLAPSATFSTGMTITFTDADDVQLSTITIPQVSLSRNSTTTLTGAIFSAEGTLTVGLDDAWGEGTSQTF